MQDNRGGERERESDGGGEVLFNLCFRAQPRIINIQKLAPF